MGVRWSEEDLQKHLASKQVTIKTVKKAAKKSNKSKSIPKPFKEITREVLASWFVGREVISKKNSKRAINGKVVLSEAASAYKKATQLEWRSVAIQLRDKIKELGLEYPVRLGFYFIRKTDRQYDFINMAQLPLDLIKAEKDRDNGIPDDSMNYVIPEFCGWEKDENNTGVELYLLGNLLR